MTTKNFDFDSDCDDDESRDPIPEAVESQVTVEGLLVLKYGKVKGRAIYRELSRVAHKAAREAGGLPGLLFNDAGGEFVSFHGEEKEDY